MIKLLFTFTVTVVNYSKIVFSQHFITMIRQRDQSEIHIHI